MAKLKILNKTSKEPYYVYRVLTGLYFSAFTLLGIILSVSTLGMFLEEGLNVHAFWIPNVIYIVAVLLGYFTLARIEITDEYFSKRKKIIFLNKVVSIDVKENGIFDASLLGILIKKIFLKNSERTMEYDVVINFIGENNSSQKVKFLANKKAVNLINKIIEVQKSSK